MLGPLGDLDLPGQDDLFGDLPEVGQDVIDQDDLQMIDQGDLFGDLPSPISEGELDTVNLPNQGDLPEVGQGDDLPSPISEGELESVELPRVGKSRTPQYSETFLDDCFDKIQEILKTFESSESAGKKGQPEPGSLLDAIQKLPELLHPTGIPDSRSGIGRTKLKKISRALGLERWPQDIKGYKTRINLLLKKSRGAIDPARKLLILIEILECEYKINKSTGEWNECLDRLNDIIEATKLFNITSLPEYIVTVKKYEKDINIIIKHREQNPKRFIDKQHQGKSRPGGAIIDSPILTLFSNNVKSHNINNAPKAKGAGGRKLDPKREVNSGLVDMLFEKMIMRHPSKTLHARQPETQQPEPQQPEPEGELTSHIPVPKKHRASLKVKKNEKKHNKSKRNKSKKKKSKMKKSKRKNKKKSKR